MSGSATRARNYRQTPGIATSCESDEPVWKTRVAQRGFDRALSTYEIQGQVRGSNFGAERVEIAAIAENFTTGLHHGEPMYWTSNGTSNAGPVVDEVAARILSLRPDLDAAALKSILMESATPLEALRGKVASGGVVNAHRVLQMALER